MTEHTFTDQRYGATPVLSRAGGVPVPLPRTLDGITQATRASSSKGHHLTHSRRVIIKQRRLHTVRATSTQTDIQSKQTQQPKQNHTDTQPKHTQQPKQNNNLNIIQINISGISNKKTTLAHLFSEKDIHVALVQESQHQNTDPHISNYTPYPCDHDSQNCQGIITYIRNDITGTVEKIESDRPTDFHKITIWHSGSKYTIFNIYNPPWNNCSLTPLTDTIYQKTIVAGDFNGHSPLWGYDDVNKTGKAIEEICESTNLSLLQNENSPPTLLHRVTKNSYRPDLTMISSDLLNKHSVDVLDDVGSDHRPILISILTPNKKHRKRKTRWNFKKANWELYNETLESNIKTIAGNFSSTEQLKEILYTYTTEEQLQKLNSDITSSLLEASAKSIPRGCRKNYKPFWNDEINDAVSRREAARKLLEEEDSDKNKINYNKECAKVRKTIKSAKRNTWAETTGNLNLSQGGAKAWSLLDNLNSDNRRQNPKPMMADNETIIDDQKKAEKFNKHFASVNKSSKLTKEDKDKLQSLKAKERAPGANISTFEDDFTMSELKRSMRKLKNHKSPGPDHIHNEMLKHLGLIGRTAILCLINLTWRTGNIPKAWRNAILTPILKKGKPQDDFNSYRPISITSCLGKLAERMVNGRLYWWLETSDQLSKYQAGFRAGCRTEDQLFRLSQRIIDGFQEKKHTTAIFVDLKQAYDRVWRKGLLLKMQDAGIHGKIYQWLKFFLIDRTIQTKLNDGISSKEILEEGLPQGSPLSCTLFLLFINDLPDLISLEKALYADDLALWHTSKHPTVSRRRINEELVRLGEYCDEWKLKINYTKTVYTVFTLSPKVAKQKQAITIQGHQLEKDENPTYLGVKLDPRLTLNEQLKGIKKKANNRLKLLKRLASTSWGADKETLRQLYLGYVRSTMDYTLALQSISSKTTRLALDKIQNHALRFISGALRSTPTAACEIHTNIEPMHLRREAAVVETMERYKRQDKDHPNRGLVDAPRPAQRIKRKSIITVADDLKEKYRLPENREPLSHFDHEHPPNIEILPPTIKTHLIQDLNKQNSDAVSLMNAAQRTIDSYPDEWIHIYTDGSAFKGTINAGYGARVQFPDQTCEELSDSCGAHSSNYEAEAKAIEASLQHISNLFSQTVKQRNNIVIFSDAKSVLEALNNEDPNDKTIRKLSRTISNFIAAHSVNITLQWIPGHTNIPGNEQADKLAKQGARCIQLDDTVTMNTAKQTIKQNKKEDWMNEWANNTTGRSIFNHMTTPNPRDKINKLNRDEQVTIFRLRSQHVPLNSHLKRIGAVADSRCPLCPCPDETVAHHLFDCPTLGDLRTKLLPQNPNIANTLYTNPEQLRNTHTYFVMANSRRTRAQ